MDISRRHQVRHPSDRLHLLRVPTGATHGTAYAPYLRPAAAEADTVACSRAVKGRRRVQGGHRRGLLPRLPGLLLRRRLRRRLLALPPQEIPVDLFIVIGDIDDLDGHGLPSQGLGRSGSSRLPSKIEAA